ncbi:BID domain-containing protein [Mesorhizobium calcicola]|uniref:BID domain-containing protein n=1 Tax=Mesorhizobium calcicola TaxID=1300310 RepID=A0ABW4WDX4_9HYPH
MSICASWSHQRICCFLTIRFSTIEFTADSARDVATRRPAQVRRERTDRTIYLQTAYRDAKAATARLDQIIARDGATSAARRLASDPAQLGELRGREGFFAGAKAREERKGRSGPPRRSGLTSPAGRKPRSGPRRIIAGALNSR